jgi:hypothetical protein
MDKVISEIGRLAEEYAEVPMLSRTHGQTASPTTMGKEMAVFAYRLQRQRDQVGLQGPALCCDCCGCVAGMPVWVLVAAVYCCGLQHALTHACCAPASDEGCLIAHDMAHAQCCSIPPVTRCSSDVLI